MPGASGPCVETSIHDGIGRRPISPAVGFRPARPQNAAGVRIEPPPSVPVASGTRPAASAAPDPPRRAARRPLEPPGVARRAEDVVVGPSLERELGDVRPADDRSRPPRTIRSTVISLRSAAGRSSIVREPKFVTMPTTSVLSLTRSGRPASGPSAPRSSSARASAERLLRPQRRHRVQRRVQPLDPSDRLVAPARPRTTRRSRTACASSSEHLPTQVLDPPDELAALVVAQDHRRGVAARERPSRRRPDASPNRRGTSPRPAFGSPRGRGSDGS